MRPSGAEMTTNEAECAHCGGVHAMGRLTAFTHAPGLVMRCPSCGDVMLMVVETPRGTFVDIRGSATLHMARRGANFR